MSEYNTQDLLMLESIVSKMRSVDVPTPQQVNNDVGMYDEDDSQSSPRLDVSDELRISVITPLLGKIRAYSGYDKPVSPARVVETLQSILDAVQNVSSKFDNMGLIEDETVE